MNRNIALTVFCNLLFFSSFSQKNLIVEYDKYLNNVNYKESSFVNGKYVETSLPKAPRISNEDIITVKVTNVNTFLYKIDIVQDGVYVSQNSGSNIPGFLGTIMNGIAPFGSILSSFDEISSVFDTRGESSYTEEQKEIISQIEHTIEELTLKISELNTTTNLLDQSIITLYSEDLPVGENKAKLISNLMELNESLQNPIDPIVSEIDLTKKKLSLIGLGDEELTVIIDELNDLSNSMNLLRKSDYVSLLKKENIESIISSLKKTDFTYQEKFMSAEFFSSGEKSLGIDDGEAHLNKLKYVLSFYNNKSKEKKQVPLENSDVIGQLVKYYYPNRYLNSIGEIVNLPCSNCKPVLQAEGYLIMDAQIPRYIDGIFYVDENGETDNTKLNSDAIGTWIFYNENGEIDRVDNSPAIYTYENTKSSEDPLAEETQTSQMPEYIKSIELPVKGASSPYWSTGVYLNNSFSKNRIYDYRTNQFGDSITIVSDENSIIPISIGSQVAYDFRGNKLIIPSINAGACVSIIGDKNLSFLFGGGLKFTKFQYLSITCGLSFVQVQVLKDTFTDGGSYSYDSILDQSISSRKFKPGYFIGINVNF